MQNEYPHRLGLLLLLYLSHNIAFTSPTLTKVGTGVMHGEINACPELSRRRLFRRLKIYRRIYTFTRIDKLDAMFLGFLNLALVVEMIYDLTWTGPSDTWRSMTPGSVHQNTRALATFNVGPEQDQVR